MENDQGCRFMEMIGRAQLRGGRRIDFWVVPGYPKTKNSSDLSHYFFGSGPNSLTKIKKIKMENKNVRHEGP